LLMTNL